MAFTDYLTTTSDVFKDIDTRSSGGALRGDSFTPTAMTAIQCSEPVPLDPSKGETLGRDGLVLDHAIYFEGPRRGLGPGYQLRIGDRRFDVDCELDVVGFGRIVRVLCREAVA